MALAIGSANIIQDFVAAHRVEITNDENNTQKMNYTRQGLVLLNLPDSPNSFIVVSVAELNELTTRVGVAAFEAFFTYQE